MTLYTVHMSTVVCICKHCTSVTHTLTHTHTHTLTHTHVRTYIFVFGVEMNYVTSYYSFATHNTG